MDIPASLKARLQPLRLISFDVDGVLTDGRITYTDDGSETKSFHVRDGSALKLLINSGFDLAILTGRSSPMVERRARELGIRHIHQGLDDKVPALLALASRLGLTRDNLAHVGDDLPDLPLFDHVGCAISVMNGHSAVQARAHYVTRTPGGEGAVSEIAELFLRARDEWPYA
ncbi:MAG: HAD hydrolase family protein [Pseudomonadales bacterium]|nr:HAD hydrolase family protein [Pseudomonadales bacterium]